jgi:hypothetical protein
VRKRGQDKIAPRGHHFGSTGLTSDVGPTIHDGNCVVNDRFECPGLALLYFVGLIVLEDATCMRRLNLKDREMMSRLPRARRRLFLSHVNEWQDNKSS